jgi:hypothetical protein
MSKSGNDLSKLIDGVMQGSDAVMRHGVQFVLGGGPLNLALKVRVLEIPMPGAYLMRRGLPGGWVRN